MEIVTLPEWERFVKENPSLFYEIFIDWVDDNDYGIAKYYKKILKSQEKQTDQKAAETPNQEILNDLSEMFEKQVFTDVTFRVSSREIKGHKSILSCN